MIRVEGVTKRFGRLTAVDSISFEVPDGELFALLGTNGAGKTTIISCMVTLLPCDEGSITIDGLEPGRDGPQIRERIGVVFQQSLLDPMLTVDENLRLRAKFSDVPRSRIDELSQLIAFGPFRDRRYGVLSGGEKRRVDIARALLNQPQILFLDEPTAGLDPQSREQVWRAIAELRKELGLTVVLTTHYMQETEAADHVVVLDRGHILAEGTPMALRTTYSRPSLLLVAGQQSRARVIQVVEEHLPGSDWFEEGGAIHLPVPDSAAALPILLDLRGVVTDFQLLQGSMEDVFLNLTAPGRAS